MADNRIITAPYEILIRFGCELGEKAGTLRGVSLQQLRFEVDSKGVIVSRLQPGREDLPKDFPSEKIAELLGAKFAAFNIQFDELTQECNKTKKELERTTTELTEQVAVVTAQRDGAIAERAALAEQLEVRVAQIAVLTLERDALKASAAASKAAAAPADAADMTGRHKESRTPS